MKYNTLRDYMGGGRNMPMSYQRGGSRNIIAGARLSRKGIELADQLDEMARKANQRTGRMLGFGKAGAGLLSFAAPAILNAIAPGAGLLTTALAKGALTGLGRFAGEKLGGARSEKVEEGESTGFGTQIKKDIASASRDVEEGSLGRALGAGAGTALFSGLGDFAKAKIFGGGNTVMARGADGSLTEQAIPQADVAGFDKAFEQSGALDMPGGAGGMRLGLSEAPGNSMQGMLGNVSVPELNLQLDDFSNLAKAPSVSEKAFQASLPDAMSLGQDNMLLEMAQQSLAKQREMEQLSRGLGSYIEREEGLLGLKEGGQLKQIPEGNKGLAKLPEEVRKRMGYMMQGGMMDDYMKGGMMDEYMGGGMMDMYMYGGMTKKKKKSGYMGGGMTMGRGLIDMMPFKRRIV